MRQVVVTVRGKVQGVFFRASTQQRARELGLSGWVRNLPDGSVELAARGPEAALEALLDWLRVGPPQARVDALDVQEEEALDVQEEEAARSGDFQIRRD